MFFFFCCWRSIKHRVEQQRYLPTRVHIKRGIPQQQEQKDETNGICNTTTKPTPSARSGDGKQLFSNHGDCE